MSEEWASLTAMVGAASLDRAAGGSRLSLRRSEGPVQAVVTAAHPCPQAPAGELLRLHRQLHHQLHQLVDHQLNEQADKKLFNVRRHPQVSLHPTLGIRRVFPHKSPSSKFI